MKQAIIIGLLLIASAMGLTYNNDDNIILQDIIQGDGVGADCAVNVSNTSAIVYSAAMTQAGSLYYKDIGTLSIGKYCYAIECNLSTETFSSGDCFFVADEMYETSLAGTLDANIVELNSDSGAAVAFEEYWEGIYNAAGTAQGAGNTYITLAAGAIASSSYYTNDIIYIIRGTGEGQARRITYYDGATKVANITTAWSVNPDATSVYIIIPSAGANVEWWAGTPITESFATETQATNIIANQTNIYSQFSSIASNVWGYATRTLTSIAASLIHPGYDVTFTYDGDGYPSVDTYEYDDGTTVTEIWGLNSSDYIVNKTAVVS